MTNKKAEELFLDNYDITSYEKPSVTVDVVAFTVMNEEEKNYRKNTSKKLRVLLMKRKDYPYMDRWALPGGFVGLDENLENATKRVLESKTDLDKAYLEQLYTWGELNRDPRHRIFSISYLTLIQEANIKSKDKSKSYEWFDLSMNMVYEKTIELGEGQKTISTYKLEFKSENNSFNVNVELIKTVKNSLVSQSYNILYNEHIAFDHAKIIAYALIRIREKLEYTEIAFSLMPEKFTLTELQQVYEVILNKELLKANFRRKIAGMVTETEDFKSDAGHRPSKLYKFNNGFK